VNFAGITPLYASPAGGGSGYTAASRCTLEEAIVLARTDAVIELAAGAYAGPAAIITKRIRIVPASGASPTLASGRMWQSRTSGASFTISGYTATAVTGTNETYITIVPSDYVPFTKPAVVALHGASGTEEQFLGSWPASLRDIVTAIVAAGYPMICPYAAGNSWGNLTAMDRITEAVAVARTGLGATTAPVVLFGGSMGGANALNWAKRNLADTACVVGAVPVSDISDIHTNNRSGLAGQINTAHSTWTEETRGADHNPATFAATALAGLPYQAWGATSDTTCLPATVEAVATAISGTYTEVAGDHTSSMANVVPATVVSFIEEHT
jgi:pimeloyl-ACP methyl ester carboxylesterase